MNTKKSTEFVVPNELESITQEMLVEYCLTQPFPGSSKWDARNPIWDAFLPGSESPRDAWFSADKITKAVKNMYWIIGKGESEGKYFDFNQKHRDSLKTCIVENNKIVYADISLLYKVLTRFTVAKIAPKVTALRYYNMYDIIKESNIDISSGVYVPMAGFGGIKEAAEFWYKENKIPKQNTNWDYLIETYDINANFCDYYGWVQRDMLAQVIETDKTCLVCPPFGKKYEHWKGTPDEMADITFIEWYELIKKHVKAKDYIIVGPEIDFTGSGSNKGFDSEGNKRCHLFSKTVGIMLWTDEMVAFFKNDKKARIKAGIKE